MRAMVFKLRTTERPMPSRMASAIRYEAIHHGYEFAFQVGIIHSEQQVFVAAFTQKVANAFVHGYAGRGDEAWHGRNHGVIARRNHQAAAPQNADHFVHVE